MPTYCWKCRSCGSTTCIGSELEVGPAAPECSFDHSPQTMVRDYRSEGVGLSGMVVLKQEREMGGKSAIRDLFLPTAEDFAGPGDPDGAKGIKQWNDEHDLKESAEGAKPWRPEKP